MSDKTTMTAVEQAQSGPVNPPFPNMVWIPGGTFLMGSDKYYPEEAPAREVTVVEAAKINGLGGGAFASLASWREKNPKTRLAQRAPSSEKK